MLYGLIIYCGACDLALSFDDLLKSVEPSHSETSFSLRHLQNVVNEWSTRYGYLSAEIASVGSDDYCQRFEVHNSNRDAVQMDYNARRRVR